MLYYYVLGILSTYFTYVFKSGFIYIEVMYKLDMIKMVEQAKALSELFNQGNEEKDDKENNNENKKDENSDEQFKKMIKMAQMMKVISEINNENNIEKESQKQEKKDEIVVAKKEKYYMQPFDNDLQTPAIRTIKAAIPHLEYKYQKNMGILVKVIELDNLLKKYKNMTVEVQGTTNTDWKKGMLLSIKPQMDYKKQQMIEMLIKFIDLKEIMENLNKKESIQ